MFIFLHLSPFLLSICAPNSKLSIVIRMTDGAVRYHLEEDVGQYCDERIGEIKNQPELNRFDFRGDGQAWGHWDEDGGEDHHAGDVDGVDQVVLRVPGDVVGQLVYQVHQNRRNVGHF